MSSRLLLVYLAIGLWLYWRHLQRKTAPRRVTSGAAKRQTLPLAKSPHEVLGVEPGASRAEIKRAYQALVQQYHPDKVATMAAELQALAEQRTKELNAAYNQLMGD